MPTCRRLRLPLALLLASVVGTTAGAAPFPWRRTESRQPCANADQFRQPFFGDTHIHTAYSSDAVFAGTREDPRGAYRFAKGETIGLPPYDGMGQPMRTAQLRRPLDFTAVTDHAEQFGEIYICQTPGLPGYDSADCVAARTQLATPPPALPSLLPPPAVIGFLLGYGVSNPPQRFSWCGPGGVDCLAQASLVWQDTRAAAEQYYDRTEQCRFTTFVGYEWSGQPGGNNLHRNVIFRNDVVPALPTSYMEQPTPEGLWNALRAECGPGLPGCDVLTIPHNPNASGGLMFAGGGSITADQAAARSGIEPVVEMNQHKGDSECRTGVGGSSDEECGFEKLNRLQLFSPISNPNQNFPALNYIRNVLEEGLVAEQRMGVNPFRLGMIGSTDDHNATPGATEEVDFGDFGHIGLRDHAAPVYMVQRVTPGGIEANPGGLAVVWAEENSRDALFAAIRRREVYGTSGSRPILRFFAGREPGLRCGDPDFVETAYAGGVPMGGEIGPVRGNASPRFGVLAFRDAGAPGLPGTPLQRVQIVKGWVDAAGVSHEQVYDVAGSDTGAAVDTQTCTPSGPGSDSLCAVWTDPDFDADQRAFYYARLLENPTCRWSTRLCNAQGIDCSGTVPPEWSECCRADAQAVPKTIQERAWSSPIWYRPEGVKRVRGSIKQRRSASERVVDIRLKLGGSPVGLDPATQALTFALRDDDDVYTVTIPAGTMQATGSGSFRLSDSSGSVGGIRTARLDVTPRGTTFRLRTVPLDLAGADFADHFMEVSLRGGPREIVTTPLWRAAGTKLKVNS